MLSGCEDGRVSLAFAPGAVLPSARSKTRSVFGHEILTRIHAVLELRAHQ